MGLLARLFSHRIAGTITPEVIGKSLFYFVGKTISTISDDLHEGRLEIGSIQPAIYLREKVIMNLFAADFAVFLVYGHGPLKKKILDSFWSEHAALQTSSSEYAALTKGCKERHLQYNLAVQQGGDLLLTVGRVFASACGCPGEHLLAMQAGTEFANTSSVAKDILGNLGRPGTR